MTADNFARSLELAVSRAPDVVTAADAPDVVAVAGFYYRYLAQGQAVRFAGTVQVDGGALDVFTTGGTMANIPVAATVDDNTVTFAVNPQDDHNDDTADQLTVTSDDTAGVTGTLAVNPDTHGAVLTLNHVEGVVNVTFADPSAPAVEDLVFTVTVGAGATQALAGTATVA